jgi:hypothetical protein
VQLADFETVLTIERKPAKGETEAAIEPGEQP